MDFSYWTNIALHPQEALNSEKDATDWMSVIKLWAITGFWAGLASGVGMLAGQGITGLSLAIFFSGIMFYPLNYPILYFLIEGVFFLVARFLGGKGSFLNHFYFIGLTGRIILPLGAMLLALSSPVAILAGLFVSVYWVYPRTVAYKRVHGFDWTKAILVWLIPGAIVGLLGLLIFFLLLGAIASNPALFSSLNMTTT